MARIVELRRRAQRRSPNLYDTWFTRRVSIYVTAVLHARGVGPNAVSSANLLVGVLACVAIGIGTGPWPLAGVCLVHAYAVLDSVDGELARLTECYSLQGLFLEDLSAYAMINGFWLAVAAYLWRTTGAAWPAAVAIAACAFFRNAPSVARRALMKSILTRRPPAVVPTTEAREHVASGPRRVLQAMTNPTNVWVTVTTCILVERIGGFGRLHLVAIAFAACAGAAALKEAAAVAIFAFTPALDRELLRLYRHAAEIPHEAMSGVELAREPGIG